METIGLSQVLRILPAPALQVRVHEDALMVIDANLPCRMLWPQIPSSGMYLQDDMFGKESADVVRRIARGGGIAQLELCLSADNQYVLHIAHCCTDSAILVIHDRRRLRAGPEDQSLMRMVMDKVTDWVLWVGPDNQLIYTSPAVFAATGYTSDELMYGESLLERLIHEEDRSLFFHHKQEAIEGQRSSQLQFRIRHRDGTVRWIQHSCHPVYEADGSFRGIVSSNRDVTAQKRSEDLLRLMQFSMERAQEAVFWLRRDSSFFYVNEAACRLLGYSQAELLNMKAGDVNPSHIGEEWESHWKTLRESTAINLETVFLCGDGSVVPVEISANFLWFEGREFNCSFVRDITERKRHEKENLDNRQRLARALLFGKMGYFEYDVITRAAEVTEETTTLLSLPSGSRSIDGKRLLSRLLDPEQVRTFRRAVEALIGAQDADREETILLALRDSAGVRWMNTRLRLHADAIPHSQVIIGVVQDVSELRRREDAIRAIVHATEAIGERFFISLAKELCATLGVQYAFVSEMLPSPVPEGRTVAFCSRDQTLENMRYFLPDTPCEDLLGQEIVRCLSDAQRVYPNDGFLAAHRLESYLGIRLNDSNGDIIGMLGVMDTRPMQNSELSIQILRVVAGRAAAELQRIRSERASDQMSRQFQQVFESSVDGMCIIDGDQPYFVNNAALRMFGLQSNEELAGTSVFDFFHADEHERIRGFRSRDASGQRVRLAYETIGLRRDGSTFDVEVRVSEYQVSERPYSLVILRDVTERKRFERDLISEKDRAMQSERLKDAFVATVSHEIRTPLNIISGYTELLRSEFSAYMNHDTGEFFNSVQAGVRRLERTVDLILNISRIQSGDTPLHPVPVDLGVFLRWRVEDFRRTTAAKGIELRYEILAAVPPLMLDEYSMSQAIDNLLDNANKFTEKGSIAVRLYRPAQDVVAIDIEDTGIGISDDYLPFVFDRYSQEDVGYTRKYEGLGLGMTLVREYLRLNGGRITVSSEKGRGTKFTILFDIPEQSAME